ncbi:MAG TPA: SWFGD domain-containing protein, partial [Sphingomicrobium sp.]|nr:SWFGD domain-containing protein [Sphingomicrobium sp.]
MAYDRYDSRQEPREPRSRQGRDESERLRERGQDRDDRGFFDRAGDEVASWFGDEEAERRRREDARFQGRDDDRFGSARQTDSSGNEEFSRYDRQPRFRDEGYRRPYTGRFSGRRSPGDDDRYRPMTGDYGRSERE